MIGKVAIGDYGKIGVITCQKQIRLKMKWVGLTIDKKSLWISEKPEIISHSLEEYIEHVRKSI